MLIYIYYGIGTPQIGSYTPPPQRQLLSPFEVRVRARRIAPITAISVEDNPPSPENTKNTMSRNKYQLFSNITPPNSFFITICPTMRQSALFFSDFYMLICWYGNLTWFWNSNPSQKLSPKKRSVIFSIRIFWSLRRCNTDKNHLRIVHKWNVCQRSMQPAFNQSNHLLAPAEISSLSQYCQSKTARKNHFLFPPQQKDWRGHWGRCRIFGLYKSLTKF